MFELARWSPDWIPAAAIVLASGSYALGARRLRSRGRVSRAMRTRERWFALAMLAAAIAVASPLDALGDELFVAHMAQHVILAGVVPPLLVLGAPERVLLWTFPRAARRAIGRALAKRVAGVRRLWRFATLPAVAWASHAVAVWAWHAPALYERALGNDSLHALEHLTFVATGVVVWFSVLRSGRACGGAGPGRSARPAYATGILTLFATALQTGALGALLALSHRVLYPAQSIHSAHWGLSPLEDQQLAGLVMWVPGGLLYIVAICVLFVAWLEPAERRRFGRGVASAAVAAGGATACSRAQANVVAGGDATRGKQNIEAIGCGACHEIDGVPGAAGKVGPPLDGVASRAIIGGVLPNTPDNMMLWIEDPPSLAPHTAMPNLGVSAETARDIVAYLYTLK